MLFYCVKCVHILSYSGPFSVLIWENTDQNNSKYGHFWRSDRDTFSFCKQYCLVQLSMYFYFFLVKSWDSVLAWLPLVSELFWHQFLISLYHLQQHLIYLLHQRLK